MATKFFNFLFPLIWLSLLSGCDNYISAPETVENKLNNFKDLSEKFKTPPIDYSTAPFWVWNDRVTREKIDRQLIDYKERGMHMLFIHPRP